MTTIVLALDEVKEFNLKTRGAYFADQLMLGHNANFTCDRYFFFFFFFFFFSLLK